MFGRLAQNRICPRSANRQMYARAIYVGRALKLRYGKWVNCVEDN